MNRPVMTPLLLCLARARSTSMDMDTGIALIKHTGIGDHADFELCGEIFNLTDTPAFSRRHGSYGSALFGSIASTATDPRVVQFDAHRLLRVA